MSNVTVIIPHYNQAAWLFEAVESACQQTIPPAEIVVIDDASPDRGEAAREITRRLGVTLLQLAENGGVSVARNTGFAYARTPWVLTVDADDRIDPTYIAKTATGSSAEVVYTDIRLFGDTNTVWRLGTYSFERLRRENCITSCALISREVWQAVQRINGYGYDPTIARLGGYEDWLFYLEAGALGYHARRIPEPLFWYRKHGPSMITKANYNAATIKAYMSQAMLERHKIGTKF